MVLFVRIDDRLIHGQVVEGWVHYVKATRIAVADDRVAANPLQRSIMEISVPRGLKVSVDRVEDVCRRLGSIGEQERVILLFSNPGDLLAALKAGLSCGAVNLGGMHYVPGKRKLLDVLAVDESDIAAFREIIGRGVRVDIQSVPSDRSRPLANVLDVCTGRKMGAE